MFTTCISQKCEIFIKNWIHSLPECNVHYFLPRIIFTFHYLFFCWEYLIIDNLQTKKYLWIKNMKKSEKKFFVWLRQRHPCPHTSTYPSPIPSVSIIIKNPLYLRNNPFISGGSHKENKIKRYMLANGYEHYLRDVASVGGKCWYAFWKANSTKDLILKYVSNSFSLYHIILFLQFHPFHNCPRLHLGR